MAFFTLPAELRVMVYKEICPARLNFPYSAVQDGLQFLAVSRLTRQEFLPHIRHVSSVVLKLRNQEGMDDFLRWLSPNPRQASVHLTELVVEGWVRYHDFDDFVAFCMVQHQLHHIRIRNSNNSLESEWGIPNDDDSAWIYREPLLITKPEHSLYKSQVWRTLWFLAMDMSKKGRSHSTLQYDEINTIIRTAARSLDTFTFSPCYQER